MSALSPLSGAKQTSAERTGMSVLTRCWQILLKGVIEVRDSANPYPAAEMALVRLGYALDLPSAEQLVRRLRQEKESSPGASSGSNSASGSGAAAERPSRTADMHRDAPEPPGIPPAVDAKTENAPEIGTLEDVVKIARAKGERILATQLGPPAMPFLP